MVTVAAIGATVGIWILSELTGRISYIAVIGSWSSGGCEKSLVAAAQVQPMQRGTAGSL